MKAITEMNTKPAETKPGIMSLMTWPVAAISRIVAGPPMTDRQRLNSAIAESKIRAYFQNYR